jgi:glutamyl-tRNA synthetase
VTVAPRVRFAPAPTGYLHVGGARSALFNWLYARQHGGTLVLRIEDTDQERSRPELIEAILESLTWLGIDWDEGPIFQSDRRDLYRAACEKLLADGVAYLIDDEKNELPGTEMRLGAGVAVRVPDEGAIEFEDLIRGPVRFELENVEDFVIWRGRNDTPTFVLANAIDDVDLRISHVIRGEDLLSSTPKVLFVRQALGHTEVPIYAHLPLLVNEARQKLSKRKDDVAVGDYVHRGYLPQAMANYLALLGWGPPDGVEVRPMAEIVELFRLEDVVKGAAFFDLKKLEHINGEWIRRLSLDEFLAAAEPWATGAAVPWPADRFDDGLWRAVAPLVQERLKLLSDIPAQVDWLFLADPPEDADSWEKAMAGKVPAAQLLDAVIEAYAVAEWEAETLKETLRVLGEERFELKLGKAQAPVRVAVTGRTVGPPLFEGLVLLGRDETLRRLRAARTRL